MRFKPPTFSDHYMGLIEIEVVVITIFGDYAVNKSKVHPGGKGKVGQD